MKKNDFTGWWEVFCFSFLQGVKQKAFVVFILLSGVVLLLSMPVSTLLKANQENKEEVSEVTVFTIYDETGLGIDYTQALPKDRFPQTEIKMGQSGDYSAHVKAMEESEKNTEIIVKITYEEEGAFRLVFVKSAQTALKEKDYKGLAECFENFFEDARIEAVDVSAEQYAFINQAVETRIQFTKEDGEISEKEDKEGISLEEYYILLGGIMVVMFVISFSGSSIATSIVTEKSTKVVEYLMINVRPMALIVGKILACLATVLLEFAVMGACFLISSILNIILFGMDMEKGEEIEGYASAFISMSGLNLGNLALILLILLLGVLFFGITAGLTGASVSKMEEMAEGTKIYSLLMLAGYFVGFFQVMMQLSGSGGDIVVQICSLIPISAPFILPGNLLLGKVGAGTALLSIVILAVVTALLFSFTAKVYEAMIFYNGKALKLKDIWQIAKNRQNTMKKGEN